GAGRGGWTERWRVRRCGRGWGRRRRRRPAGGPGRPGRRGGGWRPTASAGSAPPRGLWAWGAGTTAHCWRGTRGTTWPRGKRTRRAWPRATAAMEAKAMPSVLEAALTRALSAMERARERRPAEPVARPVGTVVQAGDGVARISGLPRVKSGELLEIEGGISALALDLEPDTINAVLLDRAP